MRNYRVLTEYWSVKFVITRWSYNSSRVYILRSDFLKNQDMVKCQPRWRVRRHGPRASVGCGEPSSSMIYRAWFTKSSRLPAETGLVSQSPLRPSTHNYPPRTIPAAFIGSGFWDPPSSPWVLVICHSNRKTHCNEMRAAGLILQPPSRLSLILPKPDHIFRFLLAGPAGTGLHSSVRAGNVSKTPATGGWPLVCFQPRQGRKYWLLGFLCFCFFILPETYLRALWNSSQELDF